MLTCTLTAPEGGALLGANGEHVRELVCTKVGKAKRTVAARLDAYKKQILGGVPILEGSPNLRVVVYGAAAAMLTEREVQAVARKAAPRAQTLLDDQGVGYVGGETYVGLDVVDAVYTFAQERTHG